MDPYDMKQNPGEFSVPAKMGDDGLIHFEVIRKLTNALGPGHPVVRKGKTRIAKPTFQYCTRRLDNLRL